MSTMHAFSPGMKSITIHVLYFFITSCPSLYSAQGILSINHFTVTCANVSLAVHLPHYHQQTKMH